MNAYIYLLPHNLSISSMTGFSSFRGESGLTHGLERDHYLMLPLNKPCSLHVET
jgi:hypothetical protein